VVVSRSGLRRQTTLRTTTAAGLAVSAAFFTAGLPTAAQSADDVRARLTAAAEAYVESPIVPGVSVAVVRGDEVLLQRGFGYVDLEWRVETPVDAGASYEIGSVTKQFTAAAILLLAEQGEVDLEADFTDYVDFDTGGRTVTVRRLLDHTSGIESYTDMPVFEELTPFTLPRDTLLRLVEGEPFDFEPGTALIYNNTAFFILGLIIEEVADQSYEDFVAERLFEPAGMEDSYYCHHERWRERRAHGYDAVRPDMVIRGRYLDHTWPYAAGSLCSTVADLVKWNEALHGGEILQRSSYEAMITPMPLVDGSPVRYAMGITNQELEGRRMIAHGGGINGFTSHLAYYPDDDLSVVVLQNSTAPPGPASLASDLVGIVLGPGEEAAPVAFDGDPSRFQGSYTGVGRGADLTVLVSVEAGELVFRQHDGRAPEPDEPMDAAYRGGLTWVDGVTRLRFVEDGGRVTELRLEGPSAHYVLKRSDD
jgi:CubicO group peptidase (beta-lactamase class C family)